MGDNQLLERLYERAYELTNEDLYARLADHYYTVRGFESDPEVCLTEA